jgi:hypothetical protein
MDPELSRLDAEIIARRVVDALREEPMAKRGLLKTQEVARLFGVDAEWVRANRVPLGAVRLGDGPRARLRFPRQAIDAYLAARSVGPTASAEQAVARKARQRAGSPASVPSLPAKGDAVMEW